MGTGIVYSQKTYKKEEVAKQLKTNTQILDLIEEIVDNINLPNLSTYIRESLTKLFNGYDYLKTIHKFEKVDTYSDCIVIELKNENNISTKIEIYFRINTFFNKTYFERKDMNGKEVSILNNLKILICESKIVPNDHYNKYAIYLSINDLINHAKL